MTYPNNIRSRYTYDTTGRVDTIINTQNSAVVSSYDYDYDRNGNRTEQIEINGGAAETTTYDFDALDRLTGVTYPDQTVTYTYDLAYNRKAEIARSSDNTVTKNWRYQYNDRHQLTDILDQLDNAKSITYSYDDNGNQTAKTKASEITAFVFDARDDMRRVQVGGSTVGQFLYDAAGLRIEKAGDRGIERYTYDDLSVLRQFDENNQTLAKFDYGPNRLLSLRHSTEGTQFYLMDALNSVVNLANASGAVQARYQYDAWGNKRNETGSSWNRFGFTGHEHDTESGLIYAKARFYDPETGRFLGQDAWEGDTQLPPSLHKYLYAYQNPTVYTDPDGNTAVGDAIQNGLEWLADKVQQVGQEMHQEHERLANSPTQLIRSPFKNSDDLKASGAAGAIDSLAGTVELLDVSANGYLEAIGLGTDTTSADTNRTILNMANGLDSLASGQTFDQLNDLHIRARLGDRSAQNQLARFGGQVVGAGLQGEAAALAAGKITNKLSKLGANTIAESRSGPSAQALADAEAGMPYSHPTEPYKSDLYHRRMSGSQTVEDLMNQMNSGELWGTAQRNSFGGLYPKVKAHKGGIPEGVSGFSFRAKTPANKEVHWTEANGAAKVNPSESKLKLPPEKAQEDWVKIDMRPEEISVPGLTPEQRQLIRDRWPDIKFTDEGQ